MHCHHRLAMYTKLHTFHMRCGRSTNTVLASRHIATVARYFPQMTGL